MTQLVNIKTEREDCRIAARAQMIPGERIIYEGGHHLIVCNKSVGTAGRHTMIQVHSEPIRTEAGTCFSWYGSH